MRYPHRGRTMMCCMLLPFSDDGTQSYGCGMCMRMGKRCVCWLRVGISSSTPSSTAASHPNSSTSSSELAITRYYNTRNCEYSPTCGNVQTFIGLMEQQQQQQHPTTDAWNMHGSGNFVEYRTYYGDRTMFTLNKTWNRRNRLEECKSRTE